MRVPTLQAVPCCQVAWHRHCVQGVGGRPVSRRRVRGAPSNSEGECFCRSPRRDAVQRRGAAVATSMTTDLAFNKLEGALDSLSLVPIGSAGRHHRVLSIAEFIGCISTDINQRAIPGTIVIRILPANQERERIPCRFYQLGTCTKEELCPFAHIDAATAPVPAQPKEPAVAPVEPRKQAVKPAPRAQSSGSSNRTAGSGSSKAAKPGSISIAELRKQRAWGSGSGKPGAISLSELRKQRQARQTGDRPRSAASSAAVDRTGGRLPADYRGPAGAKASARAVKRGRGASESSDSKRRDAAPSRSQKKQAAAPRSAAAAAGIVVTDEMKAARAAKFGKVATGGEGSAGGAAARAGAGRSQGGTGAGSGANEAPPKRPRVEVSASASSPATKEAQAPQPSPTVSEIGDDVLAEIEGAGDPLAGLADDDDDDDLDAELAMMEGQTTA